MAGPDRVGRFGGFGIGGETGEGALRIGGKTVDYYRTSAVTT
jgi:hypothetical protein